MESSSSIDRLSALPEEVACNILSFLPTKTSVSTSILARRWRFLWAHVPNLRFNSDHHHSSTSFLNFINRVMLLHKVHNLNTFSLCYDRDDYKCCKDQLKTCITEAVVRRNFQNLYVDLGMHVHLPVLPLCVFTCKTLVNLTLHVYGGIPLCTSFNLPALKNLCLSYMQYDSDEPLPRLLTACPVLEVLMVNKLLRFHTEIVCCYISSPTLKRLMFTCERRFCYGCDSKYYELKIDTPALRYLKIDDSVSEVVSGLMTSLVEADINLRFFGPLTDQGGTTTALYSLSVIEFVDRLSNVNRLKFSSDHNRLKFDQQVDIDVEYLWMEPNKVPKCLLSHLTSITIDGVEGCSGQVYNIVRYILRNAKVLERMEIYCRNNLKAKFDTLKRIASFGRGSEACQLVFH